jgi:hypothetical protein
MKFSNLRLGTKLAVGFTLVLVLSVFVAVIGTMHPGEINGSLSQVGTADARKVEVSQDMRSTVDSIEIAIQNSVLEHNKNLPDKEKKMLKRLEQNMRGRTID